MTHLNKKYGFCLAIALVMMTALFVMPQDVSAKTGIDLTGKVLSTKAVQLKWSMKDPDDEGKIDTWKVYRAVVDKNGEVGSYQNIALVKSIRRSYTSKTLKENTKYRFKVKGFNKKEGEFVFTCSATIECFTGIPRPEWAPDLYSKYDCSTELIEVALKSRGSYGLPAEGYQIYRRERPETDAEKKSAEKKSAEKKDEDKYKFKKVATLKESTKNDKGVIVFKDKDVLPGKTYQYKARAYGKTKDADGNEKTTKSKFCVTKEFSAVNKEGAYSVENISFTSDKLVVRLSSAKNNGSLRLDTHDTFYGGAKEYEEPIFIKRWSKDGQQWTTLETLTPKQKKEGKKAKEGKNYIILKAGESIYLDFAAVEDDTDMKELGYQFKTSTATYNRAESEFEFSLLGEGSAHQPREDEETDTAEE